MQTFCTTLTAVRASCFLEPYARRMSQAKRWQFRELHIKQRPVMDVRKETQGRFGLTKRQATANEFDLKQAVEAWRGGVEYHLTRLTDRKGSLLEQHARFKLKAAGKLTAKKKKAVSAKPARKGHQVTKNKPALSAKGRPYWRDCANTLAVKIGRITTQLVQLSADLSGPPKICFGGRKRIRDSQKIQAKADQLRETSARSGIPLTAEAAEQYQGYLAQAKHLRDQWHAHRHDRFLLVGSKGETGGNQTAQYDPSTQTLKLRLTPADLEGLSEADRLTQGIDLHGRLTFTGVYFAYGHQELLAAAAANQALTWLFFRNEKGSWQAHVTMDPPEVPLVIGAKLNAVRQAMAWKARDEKARAKARREAKENLLPRKPMSVFPAKAPPGLLATPSAHWPRAGCIGLDLNVDHVAAVIVSPDGNPLARHTFPFPTASTPAGVAQAMIGDLNRDLTALAEKHQLPIAVEDLDFSRKKANLQAFGKAHARRLSGFAYSTFQRTLQARCARRGVLLVKVNPAYTSVIGGLKYAPGYAMSRHHAAALVIARRAQGWGERIVCMTAQVLDGPGRNLPRTTAARWRHVHTLARPFEALSSERATKKGQPSRLGPTRRSGAARPRLRGGGELDLTFLSPGAVGGATRSDDTPDT